MPPLRWHAALIGAYLLLATLGALALFVIPSSSLERQGGMVIVTIWAVMCLIGGVVGVTGVITRRLSVELVGNGLAGVASLVWTVALSLQTAQSGNIAALPAICVGGILTLFLIQRQIDAWRPRG